MPSREELSNYCIIDHQDDELNSMSGKEPLSVSKMVKMPLYAIDPRTHFTGLRGGMWRMIGVGRSFKNPNVCDM